MVEIHVPELSERKEDLPLLERSFISKFAAQYGKTIRGLTPRTQVVLGRHSWPGNVRELENVIGHACMMVISDTIDIHDLPEYLWESEARSVGLADRRQAFPVLPVDAGSREEQEKRLIIQALESASPGVSKPWSQQALESASGNQSQAARILRVGRDALRYKQEAQHCRGLTGHKPRTKRIRHATHP
jgi:DNA-binding NtrC family response regulator